MVGLLLGCRDEVRSRAGAASAALRPVQRPVVRDGRGVLRRRAAQGGRRRSVAAGDASAETRTASLRKAGDELALATIEVVASRRHAYRAVRQALRQKRLAETHS